MDWSDIIGLILGVATAMATAVIAWFTVTISRLNRTLTDLTGAMESHSTIMMRLEARRQGVPVVWWDPTQARTPCNPRHDTPAELKRIYLFLPRELRAQKRKL
jgi:hypothetical protein